MSNQTWTDIACTCQISVNIHKATINELYNANKTINKVKSEKAVLKIYRYCWYKKSKNCCSQWCLICQFAQRKIKRRLIVFLVGENENAVPLSWRSRKVKQVLKNTLSAETLALDESAIQSFYLKQVLAEIIDLSAEELPIIIYTIIHFLNQFILLKQ